MDAATLTITSPEKPGWGVAISAPVEDIDEAVLFMAPTMARFQKMGAETINVSLETPASADDIAPPPSDGAD